MKYGVIVADPPWHYEVWGEGARRYASHHYDVQGTDWISSLPVETTAEDDCVLFLWATWPRLPDALQVIEEWGFTYKTLAFDWIKNTSGGSAAWGLGYWTRANSEPCLLATRGKPKRMDKGVAQVLCSPRGAHSQKPDEMYDRIERLVEGPYLELFHRPRDGMFPPRENWTFLGNAVSGNDIRVDLEALALATPPV